MDHLQKLAVVYEAASGLLGNHLGVPEHITYNDCSL